MRARSNAPWMLLLVMLPLAACQCDDAPPPPRAPQPRAELVGEELLAQLPKPEGTPLDAQALAGALPSAIGGATAEGDAQPESTPLSNEGTLSTARRTYVQDGTRITLQLSDMLHAPLLRQMMLSAKERAEQGKASAWTPTSVHGLDAVAQHLAVQNAAIANIAITERLFLNVRVEPAEGVQPALDWADKLAFEPLKKLQVEAPAPREPSQPPPL